MDKLIIECPHCHKSFSGEDAFKDILNKTLESQKEFFIKKVRKEEKQLSKDKLIEQESKHKEEKEEILLKENLNKQRLMKKLEEAKKPLTQESMEIQGEVGEKWLENFLTNHFTNDTLTEVKKGVSGGDCILSVYHQTEIVGSIYFESKRVSRFSNNWVKKLLEDMQNEGRDFGVIVTSAMPSGFQSDIEPWIERESKRIFIVKNKKPLIKALVEGLRDLIINKHQKNKELSNRLDNHSDQEKKASAFLQEGFLQNYLVAELKAQNESQDRIDKMERSNIKTVSLERLALTDRKKNFQRIWKEILVLDEIPENLLDGVDQ